MFFVAAVEDDTNFDYNEQVGCADSLLDILRQKTEQYFANPTRVIRNYYREVYSYLLHNPAFAHEVADIIYNDSSILVPHEVLVPRGTNLILMHLLAPGARIKIFAGEEFECLKVI